MRNNNEDPNHIQNDTKLLNVSNNAIFIPSNPDITVQTEVERAMSSSSSSFSSSKSAPPPNCCCQVEIHLLSNTLYSLDCDGHRKNTGGDEFYIRYEEHTLMVNDDDDEENENIDDKNNVDNRDKNKTKIILTQAVALITDNLDGSYELNFSTTPMHPHILHPNNEDEDIDNIDNHDNGNDNDENINRTITVYFEYTDNIGRLPPPLKENWSNGGYSHKCYKIDLPCHYNRPYIRVFVPPTPSVDLSTFDQVFAFGDSTFCQFLRQRPNKKGKYFFQSNLRIIGDKVRMGLNSETIDILLELLINDDIDEELSNECDQKKKALIIGSCLWDILSAHDNLQGSDFIDHCNACREFIHRLRQRYPSVCLIWKSPMAVHIHWVDQQRVIEHDRATATLFGIDRIKYMSASRSSFVYTLQTKLMEELQVPILDLYEVSYELSKIYNALGRLKKK
jgi:hypothetical protein